MDAGLFGHLANLLFAAAYLVKDILWLRLVSIAACASLIVYYYVVPAEPLWIAINWDLVFIGINATHVGILLREKRAVHFTDEERDLLNTVFRGLPPVNFMKLIHLAAWRDLKPGDVLTEQGQELPSVMLIASGSAIVSRDQRAIAALGKGTFVGEMSYLTGRPASARVTAHEACRVLSWDKIPLRAFLARHPDTNRALQGIWGADMAAKLENMPGQSHESVGPAEG